MVKSLSEIIVTLMMLGVFLFMTYTFTFLGVVSIQGLADSKEKEEVCNSIGYFFNDEEKINDKWYYKCCREDLNEDSSEIIEICKYIRTNYEPFNINHILISAIIGTIIVTGCVLLYKRGLGLC